MPIVYRCGNAPSSAPTTQSNIVLLIRSCRRITLVEISGDGLPFTSRFVTSSSTGTTPSGLLPDRASTRSHTPSAFSRVHDSTSVGVHTVAYSAPSSASRYDFSAARRSRREPGA